MSITVLLYGTFMADGTDVIMSWVNYIAIILGTHNSWKGNH